MKRCENKKKKEGFTRICLFSRNIFSKFWRYNPIHGSYNPTDVNFGGRLVVKTPRLLFEIGAELFSALKLEFSSITVEALSLKTFSRKGKR